MGHSRTLYDEERARDLARKFETEDREFERGGVSQAGTIVQQSDKQGDDLVDQQIEEKLSAQILEQEVLEKRFEKMREEGKKLDEKQRVLAKQLKEVRSETDSLRLVAELQKTDLAEGHRLLWSRSHKMQPYSDEGDGRFAHQPEDKPQQKYEEDQPRHKSLPVGEVSEKIPCQWCNKLIPFEQVMLHQVRYFVCQSVCGCYCCCCWCWCWCVCVCVCVCVLSCLGMGSYSDLFLSSNHAIMKQQILLLAVVMVINMVFI